MKIVDNEADLKNILDAARAAGREIVLVPTMGALHAGHLSLVEAAKLGERSPFVVVSVFVNPLQFGEGEDFERYPRTLEADAKLLEAHAADLLFAPTVEAVYPAGSIGKITKHAGRVGLTLEGAARPGHFDGMLTVVARLFDLVAPDRAFFGAKDAQQVFLVTEMARADYPGLTIQTAPTVREPTGLALSSRNRYLSTAEKLQAVELFGALRAASIELEAGVAASEVFEAHRRQLEIDAPKAKLEYLQLVSAKDFEPVSDDFRGQAILLIAAKIGETRLIDNLEVLI